jgi:hypothetical protein
MTSDAYDEEPLPATVTVVVVTPGYPPRVETSPDHRVLAFLQRLVGGYVEHHDVSLAGAGLGAWVNEDAISMGLPVNPVATELLVGAGVLVARPGARGTLVLTQDLAGWPGVVGDVHPALLGAVTALAGLCEAAS